MEKDLIFFGEGGITSTEANRIADMAKLSYMDDESYLQSVSFVNTRLETIDGENAKVVSVGTNTLTGIEEKLERIGKLKSLCAWLREAISAHRRLISEAKAYTFQDYAKDNGIELPSMPMNKPELTENEVLAMFDVKKRNRYYYLEAMASTYGGFIHKGCQLDTERKRYYDILQHKTQVVGTGRDTLIYTYEPSIEKQELEDKFAELQQKQISYQKELNAIKSEILSRITNDSIDKAKEYEDELYKYQEAVNAYKSQYDTWVATNKKTVAGLKIIIPNDLKDIYEEVTKLGKK